MAYVVPLDQPLSETQAKLIAQIGSMKNLTDLSFLKKFKINKGEQISTFDYLIKILRAMGIDPQIIFIALLNEIFTTEKLVEILLTSCARIATSTKTNLNPSSSYAVPGGDLSNNDKQKLTDINYDWLNSSVYRSILMSVVGALKSIIIQELMILIFGKPKKPEAASGVNGLVRDDNRLKELLDEAVCGGDEIFSVSCPVNNKYGDLTYNRIQKMEQVKNGNLTFQITCQGVQISLPADSNTFRSIIL